MINITEQNKSQCCGCNACGDVCAHKAITFKTDIEGFWYPEVNKDLCTDCGLCEKVCPVINVEKLKNNQYVEPKCYAAVHKNLETRFDSTSGGLFSAFAEQILREGGVVGGSTYTEDWGAQHILIANKQDMPKVRGSKYEESSMDGFYIAIKNALSEGKKVLVCGSPCQMAGMRSYFKKDYENLFILDWICFGIPSPKFFKKYVEYWEKKVGSKLTFFQFKIKDLGWRKRPMKLGFKNGRYYYEDGEGSLFDFGYHRAHVICRPSCYDCKFKGFPRYADITLGDFWGIENVCKNPDLDRDMGTSVVMVNNEKGDSLFSKISQKILFEDIPYQKAIDGNPALVKSHDKPLVDRKSFYDRLENDDFEQLMKDVYKQTDNTSTKTRIKKQIKCILKKARYFLTALRNGPKSTYQYLKYNSFKDICCGDKGVLLPLRHAVIDIHKTASIEIKKGAFVVGYKKVNGSRLETRLYMEENSKIIANGDYTLFYGSDMEIFKGATLRLGEKSGMNVGGNIVCADSITIGDTVAVGRNVTIRDNSGEHYIGRQGYKTHRPVVIEDHAWLCESCVVMPGVTIGTGAIIGAGSYVFSNVKPFSMVSGNPCQVVDTDVCWKH